MCGIIGVIGDKLPSQKIIEKARDSIRHRGPDDFGVYYNREERASLAHRRLSIIDLSSAGHQPFLSNDGRYVLVYNGEIYNYLELKEELKDSYDFKTKTDTEVLIASYSVWGEKCLEKFNGMFTFAIWDKKEKKLFIGRDRVGIKPFFYAILNNTFYFASEIKALLALGVEARPCEKMIFDYLYHGFYDHTEFTFFDGIKSLLPGHCALWSHSELKIKKYWDLKNISFLENPKKKDVHEKFISLLADSIKLRFRSDVPVGINLSSGLDSNSIYHYALKVTKGNLHAFSMCSECDDYNECEIIERFLSNEQKKIWHTSIISHEDVFKRARNLTMNQDQPFGGVPTISYDEMIKSAKNSGIVVLLEGQGVDELLAGYAYYLDAESSVSLSQDSSGLVYRNVIKRDFIEKHKERKEISFPAPFDSKLLNAQYRDLMFTKLPRVLRFNDHATMFYGRELRLPFLDYRIIEFCFSLPEEYKIMGQEQKVLLRDSMSGIIPERVKNTKKKGFGAIQTEWFKKYFKDEVYSLLNSEKFKNRGYWDNDSLRGKVDEFYNNGGDNSFFIWQCFNLEMWFEKFID